MSTLWILRIERRLIMYWWRWLHCRWVVCVCMGQWGGGGGGGGYWLCKDNWNSIWSAYVVCWFHVWFHYWLKRLSSPSLPPSLHIRIPLPTYPMSSPMKACWRELLYCLTINSSALLTNGPLHLSCKPRSAIPERAARMPATEKVYHAVL